MRVLGCATVAQNALEKLLENQLDGFWIHLDADVLDDAIMPAVDYRLPGGLQWAELTEVLQALMASGRAVGITITIFNPRLDPDGSIAGKFSRSIVAGLTRVIN